MNVDREKTGPRELISGEAVGIRIDLETGEIVPRRVLFNPPTHFNEWGTFTVEIERQYEGNTPKKVHTLMWSDRLLAYNPIDSLLRVSRFGNLEVTTQNGDFLGQVLPEQIRIVDPELTRMCFVGQFGYLLDVARFSKANALEITEFEKGLQEAEDGSNWPEDLGPVMKVDASLADSRVYQVFFKERVSPLVPRWDGVALSQKDRSLLPREILPKQDMHLSNYYSASVRRITHADINRVWQMLRRRRIT